MANAQRPISVPVTRDGDGSSGPPDPRPGRAPEGGGPRPRPIVQTPPIDIHEGPEGLVLEADLPGVPEDAVEIELEDHLLSLRAEAQAPVPPGASPLREEYPVGLFQRTFILSDEVDRTRISAELRNGVLRLVLPKAGRAPTRRIEITNHDD